MDSIAIAHIITRKRGIASIEVAELKQLADDYPYAQIFTLLYLKALAEKKDLSFDTALPKYAYRVTDRVKLYEITSTKEALNINAEVEECEEEAIVTIEITEDKRVSEGEVIKDILTKDEVVEDKIEESQESDEDVIQEELVEQTTVTVEVEDIAEEEESEVSMETLEVAILSNAIDSAFSHILESESEAKQNEILELAKDEEYQEEVITTETEIVEEQEEISSNLHTFSGWLTKGKLETTNRQKERLISKNELEKEAVVKKEALINSFIEKKPTISRPKTEFFSAPKKAQESVDDSSLLYSETLANIYVIQGNFPLAIKAYTQLCLTNPEKRMIFAEKIEELRKRLNNLK